MSQFIAFYLPQFHPTPENDMWWGPGFTEWRSVNTAKPLFKGHIQPKLPADLSYYDLRLPETREKQAQLAKQYGIDAFCYWHYWFGEGKRLLNQVFDEVVERGKPDFPFCLGWANHSWYKKTWVNEGKNELLIKQKYPGQQDYILHFNTMLKAFKDPRYLRHKNKLVFFIYVPLDSPEIKNFIKTWRQLAKENDLNDFYFIGHTSFGKNKEEILSFGFDAIYNDNIFGVLEKESKITRGLRWLCRKLLHRPVVIKYKEAIKYMISDEEKKEFVIPTIIPNWDHSPRSGMSNPIFINSEPVYFEKLVRVAEETVASKSNDLVVVKSWNEWGEGNYLEPDLQYGKGMLEALKRGRSINSLKRFTENHHISK